MLRRLVYGRTWFVAAAVVSIALCGCRKEETTPTVEKETVPTVETKTPTEAAVDTDAEVQAMLAKADAVDGAIDNVVSKCSGCALGMDGSHEHVLKVAGYAMHFCSADCKDGFGEDTTKAVLAMSIPEG